MWGGKIIMSPEGAAHKGLKGALLQVFEKYIDTI